MTYELFFVFFLIISVYQRSSAVN